MNDKNMKFVESFWQDKIIPALSEFIGIPAVSPLYDEKWRENGYLESAAKLFVEWGKKQNIKGLSAEVIQLEDKTPIVYLEIASDVPQTVLFYGHLDKMPGMQDQGWDQNKGPWQPVIEDDRLYGRGSVDNGYAFFTFISAIKLMQEHNIPHPKCTIIIEACEESASYDLPFYIKHLENRIEKPNLVMCLDAGGYDYERIWCINSLRGVVDGVLKISVLKEAVHSGVGSGIVPDSFRILRKLLDRIEDKENGKLLLKSCYVDIPSEVKVNIKELVAFLGERVYTNMPFLKEVKPVTENVEELLLNNTWRPTLCIVGAEGLPAFKDAINVIGPSIAVRLSTRIPPGCDPDSVIEELKAVLEKDPPYAAKVNFVPDAPAIGWSSAAKQTWLKEAIEFASQNYFGNQPIYNMEGSSIGVIALLGKKFPEAQFFLSGLLSAPGANEHAPNESLYLPAAKKMTCCVADILQKQVSH